MKRVAVFGLPVDEPVDLGEYRLFQVGKSLSWAGNLSDRRRMLTHGLTGVARRRLVYEAGGVDELYRRRDPVYFDNCNRLLTEADGADAIVFFTYPFLHPEIIARERRGRQFIMGFTDDPHSTFLRGLPYAWAYDGVFHISPSYSEQFTFDDLLDRAGIRRRYWLPLVQPVPMPALTYEDILQRPRDLCYVGNPTFSKVDRLEQVKRAFGERFVVHGRWPFRGYAGFFRPLVGERGYFRKVSPLTPEEKRHLYLTTKIALNMHVSDSPAECGNMRTYEAASHGMLLLCDRGAKNLQTTIFEEGTEAIYYDNVPEAIAKAREHLEHDERRASIAYAAYLRAKRQYSFEIVWQAFCEWIFTSAV
jgi:Glycosyl transferases group 1